MMVELFAHEDLSLEDDVDGTETDDVQSRLAAQLVVAQNQRAALARLVKLEREAIRWAAASIGFVVIALFALVLAGGGLLKSFPMTPLFLAPIAWQAFQTLRCRLSNSRNLLSLDARLESSIRVAEGAGMSKTLGR